MVHPPANKKFLLFEKNFTQAKSCLSLGDLDWARAKILAWVQSSSPSYCCLFLWLLIWLQKVGKDIEAVARTCFLKKVSLKKSAKQLCRVLFLIKLQPCSLQYQKSFRHRCFPVSFAKFLRTYNLWNPCKWLLPKMPKAENTTQPVFTCSKLTIETLEQGVKYVPKLIIKTPERRQLRRSGVFIVNFEHIPHLVLMFPSLTLNMLFPAGKLLTVFFLLFSKMIPGW